MFDYIKLDMLVRDKLSSLFDSFISFEEIEMMWIRHLAIFFILDLYLQICLFIPFGYTEMPSSNNALRHSELWKGKRRRVEIMKFKMKLAFDIKQKLSKVLPVLLKYNYQRVRS